MEIPISYICHYLLTMITALIGLFWFSKLTNTLKLIVIYMILSWFTETISSYGAYWCIPKRTNMIYVNVFMLMEGGLLLFYFKEIIKSKWIKKSITGSFFILVTLWFYCYWQLNAQKELFFPVFGFTNFLLLSYAFIYFKQLLERIQQTRIEFIPYFWITFGLLLSVVVSIMAVFCFWYLPSGWKIHETIWVLVRYSRMLLAIFISLGFLMQVRYGRN